MKKSAVSILIFVFSINSFAQMDKIDFANKMLPTDFKVYVNEAGIILNHQAGGFEEKTLPTINHYKGADGGYVAIYSHNAEEGVYSVGGGIYVVGQIRLKGEYKGRIFIPEGYEGVDISADKKMKKMAGKYFKKCKGDCWCGGDTGGWFGL